MIKSNVIYNFDEFRTLISSKAEIGAYYLIYDDFYLEKIDKNSNLIRDTLGVIDRQVQSFNIIKYISFKVRDKYSTKEIYEILEKLREHSKILLTIYNPKNQEWFLLFVSGKNDSKLETDVTDLLEMER